MPATNPRCPDNRRELRAHPTVYIYACVVIKLKQSTNQPEGCQSCSHDQLTREEISCPRSCLKIWFRETGLAVPSRVSLLILYTNAESGAYPKDSSQCPQRCPFIFTTLHHRASHNFIGSRNCVPMAFTAESPLCPNIITAVLLLYILWTPFPPLAYVCTSVESLVYTVQYHMLCFKTYR